MNGFLTALSFLTIFKINLIEYDNKNAFKFFPLIGFILGLPAVLILKSDIFLKEGLALVFLIVMTGALHLDGLADTCDALFSHKNLNQKLEIMKDSRIGVMGSIALFLLLMFKLEILTYINPYFVPVSMFCSRFIGVFIMGSLEYAREQGTGSFFKGCDFNKNLFSLLISSLLLFFFIDVKQYIFLVIITVILGKFLIYMFKKYFGGWTGDLTGAGIEFSEIIILYILAAIF